MRKKKVVPHSLNYDVITAIFRESGTALRAAEHSKLCRYGTVDTVHGLLIQQSVVCRIRLNRWSGDS